MAIKELTIQVRISDEGIASAIKKSGFDDTPSSTFEVIGILNNLLSLEQAKLEKVMSATK